jgi:ceramide glucosyltransferase
MGTFLLIVYLLFTGVAAVLGFLVALQTWEHRRFARSRMRCLHQHPQKGPAVIVVPCRGLDEDVEENLRTLFDQDYRDYEIRFVVESTEDPIFPVIRRLMAAYPEVRSQVFIAGRAVACGQKVHNLRVATARLPERVEYLAFADSDARLRRQWLRALVSQLDDLNVGASTGYRWFVPTRPSLANRLLYSINTSVAMFFGLRSPTVVWGGSWALRRDTFESVGLRDAWKGTVSDDLVVSGLLRREGLRVVFEPACMVTSPLNATAGQLFSFVRRQYLMGRFYLPRWWALALVLTTLSTLPLAVSLGVLAWHAATGSAWAWLSAGLTGLLYGLSVLAGLFRRDLVGVYCPELRDRLRGERHFDVWAGPLVSLTNWVELFASTFGRQITWRGIGYRLADDGQVTKTWRLESETATQAAPNEDRQPVEKLPDLPIAGLRSRCAKAA